MDLKAFMLPSVTDETKDVIISKRFVDEKGEPLPFKIRKISQEINEGLRKQSSKPIKKNGTIVGEELDSIKFSRLLIIACTLEPNFKASELCDFYKTKDPTDVPSRMLTAGEYAKLAKEIQDFNGFNEDVEELEELAKN